MKRLSLYLIIALLAFSVGSLAVFFWQLNQPPHVEISGSCATVESQENFYQLLIGLTALIVGLPGLNLWCSRYLPERD
jgi:Flp pilus assembly protein CpaB